MLLIVKIPSKSKTRNLNKCLCLQFLLNLWSNERAKKKRNASRSSASKVFFFTTLIIITCIDINKLCYPLSWFQLIEKKPFAYDEATSKSYVNHFKWIVFGSRTCPRIISLPTKNFSLVLYIVNKHHHHLPNQSCNRLNFSFFLTYFFILSFHKEYKTLLLRVLKEFACFWMKIQFQNRQISVKYHFIE